MPLPWSHLQHRPGFILSSPLHHGELFNLGSTIVQGHENIGRHPPAGAVYHEHFPSPHPLSSFCLSEPAPLHWAAQKMNDLRLEPNDCGPQAYQLTLPYSHEDEISIPSFWLVGNKHWMSQTDLLIQIKQALYLARRYQLIEACMRMMLLRSILASSKGSLGAGSVMWRWKERHTLTSVGGAEPLASLPIPVLFLRGVWGFVELRIKATLLREMCGSWGTVSPVAELLEGSEDSPAAAAAWLSSEAGGSLFGFLPDQPNRFILCGYFWALHVKPSLEPLDALAGVQCKADRTARAQLCPKPRSSALIP